MLPLIIARNSSVVRQAGVRLIALAVALLAACGGSSVVDSPTQITVRISAGDRALLDQITHLRVSAALHEADGSWKRSVSATYDRSELRWPVDIPVTPRTPDDASKEFEVVVQALQDRDVLAEARAVTSFRRNKRVVLPLSLYTCADLAAQCADSSCQGPECEACQADGSCAPVGVTDSSTLAPLSQPDGDEPGDDAGEGNEPTRDAASSGADDAGSRDAGGSSAEAGLDGGSSDLDAGKTSDTGEPQDTSGESDAAGSSDAGASDAGNTTSDGSVAPDTSTSETSTALCSANSCDDGRACNGLETCNPSVGCQPGTPDNGTDDDGDGYTDAAGDCNDCVADINPSAAEQGGNTVDEDCDGQAPTVVPSCDAALALDSPDPLNAARAIGLCKVGVGIRWGALEAAFVRPDGVIAATTTSHGLLARFGVNNPREGSAMLALSSGAARAPGDPNYIAPRPGLKRNTTSSAVVGLPTTTRHCNNVTSAAPNDGAAVRFTLKVPSNVNRMAFDFAFFTTDWIAGTCSTYADQFAVMMQGGGSSSPINLAPDELGDVMSVNSQFVAACTCPTAPNCTYGVYERSCSLGAGLLSGTGFETGDTAGHSHASTGWLTSTVPVTAGSTLTITALIYDAGDGTYDSLALLDAFRFYRAPAGDAQTLPQVRRAQ